MDSGFRDEQTDHRRRSVNTAVSERLASARRNHATIDHLARAHTHFRNDKVEYLALVVTYRALFLSMVLMLALLYVLSLLTSVLPGTNEIVLPIVALPSDLDLGKIVTETFADSSGALLDIFSLLTLILSATYTAKALRQGSRNVLRPDGDHRVATFDVRNLGVGFLMASVTLVSWLLAMSTTIRRAAIQEMTGIGNPLMVNLGKALAIIAAWLLITAAVFVSLRIVDDTRASRTILVSAGVFAVFVVAANVGLVYAFIWTLADPDTSGSVLFVLTILAWVNIVIRGLFYAQCWIASAHEDIQRQPLRWSTDSPRPGDGCSTS